MEESNSITKSIVRSFKIIISATRYDIRDLCIGQTFGFRIPSGKSRNGVVKVQKVEEMKSSNHFPVLLKSPKFINSKPIVKADLKRPKTQLQQDTKKMRRKKISNEVYEPSKMEKVIFYYRYSLGTLATLIHQKYYYLQDGEKSRVEQVYGTPIKVMMLMIKEKSDPMKTLHRHLMLKSTFKRREVVDIETSGILKYCQCLDYNNEDFQTKKLKKPSKNLDSSFELEKGKSKEKVSKDKKPEILNGVTMALRIPDFKQFRDITVKSGKIFIIIGGYDDLKNSLVRRGWIENPLPQSPFFDLKFTVKNKSISYKSITPSQLVNHFENANIYTTKLGLSRVLKNLIGQDSIDVDTFYPRCYDLADTNTILDFVEDYKFTLAESWIHKFLSDFSKNIAKTDIALKALISCEICSRRLNLPEFITKLAKGEPMLVSPFEFELLQQTSFASRKDFFKLIEKYSSEYLVNKGGSKASEINYQKVYLRCLEIAKRLQDSFPQSNLNGKQGIWIAKPALLSRGRGIKCLRSLESIFEYVQRKKIQFVVQKYIENPFLYMKRKCDIRQWVMMTNFGNELEIWFYEECYIRLSAEDYDSYDIKNKFSHLTNNSIAKYSSNFHKSEIVGNMVSQYDFAVYLREKAGHDIFFNKIQGKLKTIVLQTLKSGFYVSNFRNNSFEMFGFDFMIDTNFNPWIIEVNSSPAMDYSTAITTRLVKMVMEDCVKVIVDWRANGNCSTGYFRPLLKGSNN